MDGNCATFQLDTMEALNDLVARANAAYASGRPRYVCPWFAAVAETNKGWGLEIMRFFQDGYYGRGCGPGVSDLSVRAYIAGQFFQKAAMAARDSAREAPPPVKLGDVKITYLSLTVDPGPSAPIPAAVCCSNEKPHCPGGIHCLRPDPVGGAP